MQGVWYQTPGGLTRIATKKGLKAQIKEHPETVELEITSLFGNEYGGRIVSMPLGKVTIVGPDPHTDRKWYATIERKEDGTIKVT